MEWPLSDAFWSEEVPWSELISRELIDRLKDWCTFFANHASYETGAFDSERNRRWFDLEGVALLNDLDEAIGDQFKVRLELWF